MRQHVATCNKVELKDQVFALKQQQKAAGVQNDDSKGSNSDSETILKYVDKVRVSGSQLQHWRMLLAVTTGWSFATVENAHFVTFMQHVSPNFDLPSDYQLRTILLDAAVATVRLKQIAMMDDPAVDYHLTLTLDGWSTLSDVKPKLGQMPRNKSWRRPKRASS